jgi:hypothetical protein
MLVTLIYRTLKYEFDPQSREVVMLTHEFKVLDLKVANYLPFLASSRPRSNMTALLLGVLEFLIV